MAKIGTGAAEGKRTAYINANVLDGTETFLISRNRSEPRSSAKGIATPPEIQSEHLKLEANRNRGPHEKHTDRCVSLAFVDQSQFF